MGVLLTTGDGSMGAAAGGGGVGVGGPLFDGPAVDLLNGVAQSIQSDPIGTLVIAALVVAFLAFAASLGWHIPKAFFDMDASPSASAIERAREDANAIKSGRNGDGTTYRSRVAGTSDSDPRPSHHRGSGSGSGGRN